MFHHFSTNSDAFFLLRPFLNLNTNISWLKIPICNKMFNKNVNVDLKMLFHWGKIKKISWNKLKKWTFKNVWTQFGVLHQKQSQEFMISAFYDYPWNQKSQNARTSCIFYYRMRAIISRGLYTFHPIFQCSLYCRAVIITDNLCTKVETILKEREVAFL